MKKETDTVTAATVTAITVEIDGMACSMCEAHINDAIRAAFTVKKVTSSHKEGKTRILTEYPISEGELRRVLDQTGYRVLSVSTEPYEPHGFSLFGRKHK